MPVNELERFLNTWDREADNTLKLMRALPASQYDFRPDQGGRSLGELAWHLAEGDAYISFGVDQGQFTMDMKPPHIDRPRQVEALAPAYDRVHKDAVARIKKLSPADLDRKIPFFGQDLAIRDILWDMIICHGVHHRGQLALMYLPLSSWRPEAPGAPVWSPNREESQKRCAPRLRRRQNPA